MDKNNEVTKYLGADFSGMTIVYEIKHLKEMVTSADKYSWMIEFDGAIIGNIELNKIDELTKKYKTRTGAFCTLIGDPRNWGKGFGTCAKIAACNWAFQEGGFELIEAKAYLENIRSWSALEKLGYEFKGIEEAEVNGEPVKWKVYTLCK